MSLVDLAGVYEIRSHNLANNSGAVMADLIAGRFFAILDFSSSSTINVVDNTREGDVITDILYIVDIENSFCGEKIYLGKSPVDVNTFQITPAWETYPACLETVSINGATLQSNPKWFKVQSFSRSESASLLSFSIIRESEEKVGEYSALSSDIDIAGVTKQDFDNPSSIITALLVNQ